MDTQKMRELSLFSGGGGGILASHLLGWELKGCAEWDEGARAILKARVEDGSIPDVTLHKDVQQLDPTEYIGEVDIVTGGFPCQPFSNAGKKMGVDDPRNMWPHTVRILKGTQAPYGYFENVASLLGSGYFGTVLKDLIEAGFHVSWDCVPASAVGAPHIRDRLWIFARKAKEEDPQVKVGSLPLLTVATLEDGGWQRTTGNATWSESDELGEPAKWPRAGVAIGNIAHAIPRSGFPKGVRKYGVWPMARLPWAPLTEDEETTVQSVWPTPMAANGSKSSYVWRTKHQNDLNAAVANPDKAGWPTPCVADGQRVEQIRTPEELAAARAKGNGGCRNLREEATHATVFPTPTCFDSNVTEARSEDKLDRTKHNRPNSPRKRGLAEQMILEGTETFPTPTASERSGVNPNTGRGGGLTHEIKQRDMYPTPLAGENRKSAQSLKRTEDGGQSTPPGLAQHAELKEGIIPREYEGVPYEELPPKVQAMWPTPTQGMHKQDVNDSGEYAQRVRDSGFQEMLPVAVKLRDEDPDMWPTPRAANPGSRPNGKGGKVLSEEVQISEGERERGEYVDGKERFPTPTAEDAGRTGSADAWDEYKEEGKTTGARLRNFTQKWPTPTAASRGGKELDTDHWLESRDRHAKKGVNKHFHLDIAVQFADQGRDPKEKRDITEEVGDALAPTPVEEMFEGETLWPTPNSSRGLKGGSKGSRVAYERLVEQGVNPEEAAAMVDRPDLWPTPNANSGLRGGSNVEAARARLIEQGVNPEEVDGMLAKPSERWPTPLASDWKGANLKEGSKSASATGLASAAVKRSRAAFQTPTASDAKAAGNDGFSPLGRQLDAAPKKAGLLNPEWVAWLMGWPVGWTSPDPMPEGGLEDWLNQNHQRIWWKGEPEGLPRLTQKNETKGSRTARLKALGNGQVSLCCARSYEVLRFTLDEVLNKVKEGEQEVSLDDFFGF